MTSARDKVKKSEKRQLLLAGAVVAFVAAVFVSKQPWSLLHVDTDTKLLAIAGASALWGIYTGAQPVVESIFADSVATGRTSCGHLPQFGCVRRSCIRNLPADLGCTSTFGFHFIMGGPGRTCRVS